MGQAKANSTALIIEKNTSIKDVLNTSKSDANNVAIAKNVSGTVNVPFILDSKPINIESNKESLQIYLPELNSKQAIKTDNGTLIYQDETQPADLAVQTTKEGVRSLIKINNHTTAHEYKFTINVPNGGKLVTSA
ncbi:TPA: hypothetical protein ACSPJ7_005267 [Bacillus cereus]